MAELKKLQEINSIKELKKRSIKEFLKEQKKTIYITSDHYIFERRAYDKKILGNLMSKEEFDNIISELNMIVTKSYQENNKNAKTKVYKFLFVLIFFSCVTYTLKIICLLKARTLQKAKENNEEGSSQTNFDFILSIIFFILTVCIILGISIYNYENTSLKMLTIEEAVHSYIKKYVCFLNVYFKGVIKFIYHQKYVYIELHVEDLDPPDQEDLKYYIDKNNERKKITQESDYQKLEEIFEDNENDEDYMINKNIFPSSTNEDNNNLNEQYVAVGKMSDIKNELSYKTKKKLKCVDGSVLNRDNLKKIIQIEKGLFNKKNAEGENIIANNRINDDNNVNKKKNTFDATLYIDKFKKERSLSQDFS